MARRRFQLIWKSIRGRTIHNDVQDVLEAIGIPTSLLKILNGSQL